MPLSRPIVCHSERSRSDSDGGVEEPAVSLRRPTPAWSTKEEGHRFSRAAEALELAALQRLLWVFNALKKHSIPDSAIHHAVRCPPAWLQTSR